MVTLMTIASATCEGAKGIYHSGKAGFCQLKDFAGNQSRLTSIILFSTVSQGLGFSSSDHSELYRRSDRGVYPGPF